MLEIKGRNIFGVGYLECEEFDRDKEIFRDIWDEDFPKGLTSRTQRFQLLKNESDGDTLLEEDYSFKNNTLYKLNTRASGKRLLTYFMIIEKNQPTDVHKVDWSKITNIRIIHLGTGFNEAVEKQRKIMSQLRKSTGS